MREPTRPSYAIPENVAAIFSRDVEAGENAGLMNEPELGDPLHREDVRLNQRTGRNRVVPTEI